MSAPAEHPQVGRQARKRLATRQLISDVATHLFFERGFDGVRIEEIADAADVSRMTVFNHFPRKEDMFFDLDEQGRQELFEGLRSRKAGMSPLEALRLFPHWAVHQQRPYVCFFDPRSKRFLETLEASETLKARARGIRDELVHALSAALADSVGRAHGDDFAGLAAALLIAAWAVALTQAQNLFQQTGDRAEAFKLLLTLADRGAEGVRAALEGTPYV